ncbi:MAG: D-sedoheptulose-7-phosphate isomerase [Planctomycetota bacterium]|jgi:D-sedoheptulose 7-phosphate isomerase
MESSIKKQIEDIIKTHSRMVTEVLAQGVDTLARAAEVITTALKQNGRVYICGNGGSAADAQHIAGELVGRFRRERRPLPVIALTTDTSVITSISNDYGYENMLARQVDALVAEGDILWAISTSGTSTNVVAAAQLAKTKGARVLAFTGKNNSTLEQIADVCFCADSESTARSQEVHQVAYHIICDLVEQSFCQQHNQKAGS